MSKYDFLRCDEYTHLSDSDKQDLDTLATWHDGYTVAVCHPIDFITEFDSFDDVMKHYQKLVYFFRLMNEPKKYASNNQMYRFEQHHLLPKSLGGKHSEDNMIYLPVSYHVYVHYLLVILFERSKYDFSGYIEHSIRKGLRVFRVKGKMNECGFIEYQTLDYASRKWTLPKLIAHVKSLNINTPTEWKEKCPLSYSAATRLGMEKVKNACGITSSLMYWPNDTEEVLEQLISLVKPLGFKSPMDWDNGFNKTYTAACNRGLVEKVCDACGIKYDRKQKGTIDEDFIMRYARTCKTKTEFRNKDISMRRAAKDLGIYDKACLHMYPKLGEVGVQSFDLLLTNPDANEYDRYGIVFSKNQRVTFQKNKKKFQTWISNQIKLGFYAYDSTNHCYHPTSLLNLGG